MSFVDKLEEIRFLKESNAIEGVYDEDSLDQAIIAWEYLKKQKEMTINVILKTHKILMLNQRHLKGYERGYFRIAPIWIGGREGSPYQDIPNAMERWIKIVNSTIKKQEYTSVHYGKKEQLIKASHVLYEKIHPFIDGNGRTGRMFMNWQRLKTDLPVLIIHEGEEQQEYYKWFK